MILVLAAFSIAEQEVVAAASMAPLGRLGGGQFKSRGRVFLLAVAPTRPRPDNVLARS
jgi:hypothetical protein